MQRIIDIISNFKENHRCDKSHEWANLELKQVIEKAALAKDCNGKMYSHQKRLKKVALNSFKDKLLMKQSELENVKTFEELLQIVENSKVSGIGELACYDTALWIGFNRKIYPTKIYLHAGTRIGAEKLLKRKMKEKFIDRGMLPYPFHDKDLKDHEIEAILCIYKDEFDNNSDLKTFRKKCDNNMNCGNGIC